MKKPIFIHLLSKVSHHYHHHHHLQQRSLLNFCFRKSPTRQYVTSLFCTCVASDSSGWKHLVKAIQPQCLWDVSALCDKVQHISTWPCPRRTVVTCSCRRLASSSFCAESLVVLILFLKKKIFFLKCSSQCETSHFTCMVLYVLYALCFSDSTGCALLPLFFP